MKLRCKGEDCLHCELEKCILDMSDDEYKAYRKEKRKEYDRKHYRENKAAKIAYNKDYYKLKKDGYVYESQTMYVKYVEVRKAIVRVKKQIGEVNYNLILDELEKIEKE